MKMAALSDSCAVLVRYEEKHLVVSVMDESDIGLGETHQKGHLFLCER